MMYYEMSPSITVHTHYISVYKVLCLSKHHILLLLAYLLKHIIETEQHRVLCFLWLLRVMVLMMYPSSWYRLLGRL